MLQGVTDEEMAEADLLLHVVDASDPDREQQIRAVERILGELAVRRVERWSARGELRGDRRAVRRAMTGAPRRRASCRVSR